jgi:AbrB family looped-hinge helix DNA binding protein
MEQVFTRISTKGQVVIPASIREALKIEPGTRIAVRIEGEQIVLAPVTLAGKLNHIHAMRGSTAGFASGTDMLLEERRLERERELREEGW